MQTCSGSIPGAGGNLNITAISAATAAIQGLAGGQRGTGRERGGGTVPGGADTYADDHERPGRQGRGER